MLLIIVFEKLQFWKLQSVNFVWDRLKFVKFVFLNVWDSNSLSLYCMMFDG